MLRLLVVLAATAFAIESANVHAKGPMGRGNHGTRHGGPAYSAGNHGQYRGPGAYRSFYPSSSFGFSIGIGGYSSYGYSGFGYLDPYRFDGYGYDPYRYGTFRMPDLLNDPYFIERNRYRPPLVVRPAVPAATYPPYASRTTYGSGFTAPAVPVNRGDLAWQLQSACEELSRSLATRPDGDAWMAYLAPNRIIESIASGNSAELPELLTHYDGVVGNPQLRSVAAASGFVATRSLLSQYVNQWTEATGPRVDRQQSEQLPIPD